MKKVASAVAVVVADTNEDGQTLVQETAFLTSGVAGRQTVPRSETWAGTCVTLAKDAREKQKPTRVLSDATYFVNGSTR